MFRKVSEIPLVVFYLLFYSLIVYIHLLHKHCHLRHFIHSKRRGFLSWSSCGLLFFLTTYKQNYSEKIKNVLFHLINGFCNSLFYDSILNKHSVCLNGISNSWFCDGINFFLSFPRIFGIML